MTQTITTTTEAQAEIANRINRASVEIAGLLGQITRTTARAAEQLSDGYQINMDVQAIASRANQLLDYQTQVTLLIDMAHVVEVPMETIKAAAGTERIWFRPAR